MAVAAVALVAVGVVIPVSTQAALITTKDQTLAAVIAALPVVTTQVVLQTLSENNPLAGEVGWSAVAESGTAKVLVHPPGFGAANPEIGLNPSVNKPSTVQDMASGATYRVLAGGVRSDEFGRKVYLVAWIPLADVHRTIDRLVLLEIFVSFGLLVLVGAIAGFAVRRELRPLETMAQAADEIAGGDLSRRVAPGPDGTEVGRLGAAFNGMVDGVSALLAEREQSEDRMRQFVADASHELRTPVAAVRGYSDLYRAGALSDTESVDRAMDRMGFESRRMGALVEDLLTLTQADAVVTHPAELVDLVPLLTGAVDDATVIDRTRAWRLQSVAAHVQVRGDRLRLHQLFANLLANVRTHTPPGTTTVVMVAIVPGAAGPLAAISVIDNGPGVDADSIPRLFDRFFRVDKARTRVQGGSGLGLSIVAAIVRMHRGAVGASSTPGGGLTITVHLPLAPQDMPAVSASAGTGTPSQEPSQEPVKEPSKRQGQKPEEVSDPAPRAGDGQ
ncbi:MAG: HAMP domain-containing sensor histidine kinase [Nakamurella sp.]